MDFDPYHVQTLTHNLVYQVLYRTFSLNGGVGAVTIQNPDIKYLLTNNGRNFAFLMPYP